jgi:hypothetical protein
MTNKSKIRNLIAFLLGMVWENHVRKRIFLISEGLYTKTIVRFIFTLPSIFYDLHRYKSIQLHCELLVWQKNLVNSLLLIVVIAYPIMLDKGFETRLRAGFRFSHFAFVRE